MPSAWSSSGRPPYWKCPGQRRCSLRSKDPLVCPYSIRRHLDQIPDFCPWNNIRSGPAPSFLPAWYPHPGRCPASRWRWSDSCSCFPLSVRSLRPARSDQRIRYSLRWKSRDRSLSGKSNRTFPVWLHLPRHYRALPRYQSRNRWNNHS